MAPVTLSMPSGLGETQDDPEGAGGSGVDGELIDFVFEDGAVGEHLLHERRDDVLAEGVDRQSPGASGLS